MTAEERAKTRSAEVSAIREIGTKAGEVLADAALKLYAVLTEEELAKFSDNREHPYRLGRTLIIACADKVVEQFTADCITQAIRKARAIRNRRGV